MLPGWDSEATSTLQNPCARPSNTTDTLSSIRRNSAECSSQHLECDWTEMFSNVILKACQTRLSRSVYVWITNAARNVCETFYVPLGPNNSKTDNVLYELRKPTHDLEGFGVAIGAFQCLERPLVLSTTLATMCCESGTVNSRIHVRAWTGLKFWLRINRWAPGSKKLWKDIINIRFISL